MGGGISVGLYIAEHQRKEDLTVQLANEALPIIMFKILW
jgi:hypothetical protein